MAEALALAILLGAGAVKGLSEAATSTFTKPWFARLRRNWSESAADRITNFIKQVGKELDALAKQKKISKETRQFGEMAAVDILANHRLSLADYVVEGLNEAAVVRRMMESGHNLHIGLSEIQKDWCETALKTTVTAFMKDPEVFAELQPMIHRELMGMLARSETKLETLGKEFQEANERMLGEALVSIPHRFWGVGASPAALLRAEVGAVPFVGRESLLKEVRQWCESEPPAGVRLCVGGGGEGKTRFFIQLCKQLVPEGWNAGFLADGSLRAPGWALDHALEADRPLLLVVDYAETRLEEIGRVFERLRGRMTKVRVVLTARSEGGWLKTLKDNHSEAGDVLDDSLGELIDLAKWALDEDDRKILYRESLKSLAFWLTSNIPHGDSEPELPPKDFPTVLSIVLAAYLTIQQGTPPENLDKALTGMLRHERKFWGKASKRFGYEPEFTSYFARIATLLTMFGKSEEGTAVETVMGWEEVFPSKHSDRVEQIAGFFRDAYPGEPGVIRPDLVGEQLVLEEIKSRRKLLKIAVGEGVTNLQRVNALVVLIRLATRKKEAVTWLDDLLESKDPHIFGVVQDLVPEQTLALMGVAVKAGELSRDDIRDRIEKGEPGLQIELLRVLNNLGVRQSNLGWLENALLTTNETVEGYRKLADANPNAFLPDLAMALNNLGNRMSKVGRREEALKATREAVDIYRKLADANPDAFLPDHARALNNLGAMLSKMGQREEALLATRGAVDIYGRLAETNPDAFLHNLATSLNNLGLMLSQVGRREDALQAIQEAVDKYRELANANPDAFLPGLAMSFGAMGNVMGEMELFTDSMAAFRDGIQALRQPFYNLPRPFVNQMVNLTRGYVASAKSAGREIDEPLLLPIFAKLQSLKAEAEEEARKGGSGKEEGEQEQPGRKR